MHRTVARVSSIEQPGSKILFVNWPKWLFPAGTLKRIVLLDRHDCPPQSPTSWTAEKIFRSVYYVTYVMRSTERYGASCLLKAGLQNDARVVEMPPANLKCQLERSGAYDRLCSTPSCVD
ncbi:hypothetical protein RB195_003202 [Necator americanus]|uniref:Uncharacterized protein n=1 Tax=Necator americanus TaxID=51031 RepID=A0ABR1DMF9_NECAM